MSDAAVVAVVTGLVTITTMVTGFLTLWVKLKYGVRVSEEASESAKLAVVKADETASIVGTKIDHNTAMTAETKEAATKANEHAVACNDERVKILKMIAGNESRINSIEGDMSTLKVLVEALSKSVDSTRHEMRGHLQSVVNKLDLMFTTMSGGCKSKDG